MLGNFLSGYSVFRPYSPEDGNHAILSPNALVSVTPVDSRGLCILRPHLLSLALPLGATHRSKGSDLPLRWIPWNYQSLLARSPWAIASQQSDANLTGLSRPFATACLVGRTARLPCWMTSALSPGEPHPFGGPFFWGRSFLSLSKRSVAQSYS